MNSLIYLSKSDNPYFNLALEDHLLKEKYHGRAILLVYINRPCVIFGRFQNPWIECHLKKMHRDKVLLVRRQSGGGCVYHDKSNVNFSFICDKENYSKEWNHDLVVDALGNIGIEAIHTKRGDIRLVEEAGRKISGSASKEKKSSAFHHGTMLVNSNIEKLNDYIHSNKDHLESKSINSIRSVVANISEKQPSVTNDIFIESLVKVFSSKTNLEKSLEVVDNNHFLFQKIESGDYMKKLMSKEWRYHETPKFKVAETFGEFELELEIKKTIIEKIEVTNDSIHPILIAEVETKLSGVSLFELGQDFEFIEPGLEKLIKDIIEFFDLDFLP